MIVFQTENGKIELDPNKKEVYFAYQDYLDDCSEFRGEFTFEDMHGREFKANKIVKIKVVDDQRVNESYWLLEEAMWRKVAQTQ